jgi:hypothetical protein
MIRGNQGRRASLRSALAPGYHISRLQRYAYVVIRGDALHSARRLPLAIIFRAFGATPTL